MEGLAGRADLTLRSALGDYEIFYERIASEIENILVDKPPDSEKRLCEIRRKIEDETKDERGKLHSMHEDLKAAQKRKQG